MAGISMGEPRGPAATQHPPLSQAPVAVQDELPGTV